MRPLATTTSQFQRYDEGIWLSAVALLDRAAATRRLLIPLGWGYALPGLPSRWLFGDGAFVQHATYSVAVGLTTCLACVFVARRRGLLLGVCVAVLTLLTGVYRYALVWCAVLGFLLVVDAAVRSSSTRSLQGCRDEREVSDRGRRSVAGNGRLVPGRIRPVPRRLATVLATVVDFPSWFQPSSPGLSALEIPQRPMVGRGEQGICAITRPTWYSTSDSIAAGQ